MLAEGVMDNLEFGNKLVTIRSGRRDIQLGELLFESVELGREAVVVVTKVLYCALKDVDPDYYFKDGFHSTEEMLEGMKNFYPDMTLDSEVTVVEFNRG